MAIRYSDKYKKQYESGVDKIILNSASYKTRNNIVIQKESMSTDRLYSVSKMKNKGVSLISYFG